MKAQNPLEKEEKQQVFAQVGQIFKQRREELCLTQYELHRKLGDNKYGDPVLPYGQVTRLERGLYKDAPPMDDVCHYATGVGWTPTHAAILYGYYHASPITEIDEIMSTMSTDEQQAVLRLVRAMTKEAIKVS